MNTTPLLSLASTSISAFIIMLVSIPSLASDIDIERYIIKYKTETKDLIVSEIAKTDGEIKLAIDKHRLIAASLSPKDLGALSSIDEIEFIEIDPKNYLMAETTPYGIPMIQANDPSISENLFTDRKVCIIDSGFDTSHEDLQSTRISGDDEITYSIGNTVYTTNDTGLWYDDESGHGTMIGGIIAGIGGNNTGIKGVNPGNKLHLHIVKTFISNTGGSFWVYGSSNIAALEQCLSAGSHIINMSYGKATYSQAENQAFIAASQSGVLLIAASGNMHFPGDTNKRYPAALDAVMSVASVDTTETVASHSVHNNVVDIAAPGVAVNSTVPSNLFSGNLYHVASGTSLATAYVSGVAALVWGHYPNCTGHQIRLALQNTAKDKGALGKDNYYGHGIVQAKAAYDSLAFNPSCSVSPPPTPMQSGVAQSNLIANAGTALYYVMNIGANSANTNASANTNNSALMKSSTHSTLSPSSNPTELSFILSEGTGNADLYVRFGSKPTINDYDCRSNASDSQEDCTFLDPQEGKYYVMVRGSSLFYGVSLVGTYTEPKPPNNQNPIAQFTFRCEELSCILDGRKSSDSDGTITAYMWKLNDITISTNRALLHHFSSPGTYDVTFTVTDNNGASDSTTQTLEVSDTLRKTDDQDCDSSSADQSCDAENKLAIEQEANSEAAGAFLFHLLMLFFMMLFKVPRVQTLLHQHNQEVR